MNTIWLLVLGVMAVGVILMLAKRREMRSAKTEDANIPAKQ